MAWIENPWFTWRVSMTDPKEWFGTR